MLTPRDVRWFWLLAFVLPILFMAGCAPNSPYHFRKGTVDNCVASPENPVCYESYYQEHKDYDLAFAEYSDRGNAFSDVYISEVLSRIEEKAKKEGVVLIVFVHGWKHNASESDPNLIDFKLSLEAVGKILNQKFGNTPLGNRTLVGFYIGWRGATITVPWLEQLTFWDRKEVAEEVGKGGVNRLLLELDSITRAEPENVMVVVGHSFGGAIVVGALNDVLTGRAIQRTSVNRYARTIGDSVLVLNPAIEANQLLGFVEASIQEGYKDDQHPLFISISSDADSATHYAFPVGQTIGLLLTWQQENLERSYYFDREQPDMKLPLKEEHLDATTVGNFAPFLTHRLTAQDEAGTFQVTPCVDQPELCKPKGLTSLEGLPAIKTLPENYPLFFYKTDESVMSGHNDIFNQKVRSFLITIVDDVVQRNMLEVEKRAKGSTAAAPSLLDDPDTFERRLESTLLEMKQSQ